MFQEYIPESEPPQDRYLEMGDARLTNAFFVRPRYFQLPVLHCGSPSGYKYFMSEEIKICVHTSPDVGVIVLDSRDSTFQIWRGWFGSLNLEGDGMRIIGEGYPVENSLPDEASVSSFDGKLSFRKAGFAYASRPCFAERQPLGVVEFKR